MLHNVTYSIAVQMVHHPIKTCASLRTQHPPNHRGGDRLRRPPFGTGGKAVQSYCFLDMFGVSLGVVCVCVWCNVVIVVALLFFCGETQWMIWWYEHECTVKYYTHSCSKNVCWLRPAVEGQLECNKKYNPKCAWRKDDKENTNFTSPMTSFAWYLMFCEPPNYQHLSCCWRLFGLWLDLSFGPWRMMKQKPQWTWSSPVVQRMCIQNFVAISYSSCVTHGAICTVHIEHGSRKNRHFEIFTGYLSVQD